MQSSYGFWILFNHDDFFLQQKLITSAISQPHQLAGKRRNCANTVSALRPTWSSPTHNVSAAWEENLVDAWRWQQSPKQTFQSRGEQRSNTTHLADMNHETLGEILGVGTKNYLENRWLNCHVSNVQSPYDIPWNTDWLYNRDPYNGSLKSLYHWVVNFIPYITTQPTVFFFTAQVEVLNLSPHRPPGRCYAC